MSRPEELLKNHGVRITGIRKDIVSVVLESGSAISCKEIKERLGDNFDRVTVYRTLNTFVDEGIMHMVTTPDGVQRYALCASGACENHHHEDRHIHFLCSKCGRTYCLNYHEEPKIDIPKGYMVTSYEISASGICAECA